MFKVGDLVRCIKSDTDSYLFEGTIYKVTGVADGLIKLENVHYWWFATRFELIKEEKVVYKFKVGDTVRCVISDVFGGLVKGTTYKVTRAENCHIQLEHVDRWWGYSRFELVSDEDELPAVPWSVTHYHNNQTVEVHHRPSLPYVFMQTKIIANPCAEHVVMSPDDALALAHDITRQAMQVKRNMKTKEVSDNV